MLLTTDKEFRMNDLRCDYGNIKERVEQTPTKKPHINDFKSQNLRK